MYNKKLNAMTRKTNHTLIIGILFLILPLSSFGQNASSTHLNFGIELGGGHNQLFMQADSPAMHDRTAFSVMPSARMYLQLNTSSGFAIYSFAGYNQFGGKDSGDYPAGDVKFSSQIKIQALEFGMFGLYSIADFRFGLGAKYNHHLSISDRYDYFISATADWDWRNYDAFFANSSIDAGLRGEYILNEKFSIGAEGWFGLTDLQNNSQAAQNMSFRQNHFRLLIGYNIN